MNALRWLVEPYAPLWAKLSSRTQALLILAAAVIGYTFLATVVLICAIGLVIR